MIRWFPRRCDVPFLDASLGAHSGSNEGQRMGDIGCLWIWEETGSGQATGVGPDDFSPHSGCPRQCCRAFGRWRLGLGPDRAADEQRRLCWDAATKTRGEDAFRRSFSGVCDWRCWRVATDPLPTCHRDCVYFLKPDDFATSIGSTVIVGAALSSTRDLGQVELSQAVKSGGISFTVNIMVKPTQLRGLGYSQVCVTVTRDPSFHVDPRKVIHGMQIAGGSMMLHESQGAMIHHDIIEIIEVFKILLDMLVVGGGRDRSVRCSHNGLQKIPSE